MIFVTGGTGLIGSHLLVQLSQLNDSITATFRNESKIKDVQKVFEFYLKSNAQSHFQKIKWVKCDLLDVVSIEQAMKGAQTVYHCAALVSFLKKDFAKLQSNNRTGTENMVNISMDLNVQKFCFVSSTAAIGNKGISSDEIINEESKWEKSKETSGYSISKYGAEKEVWRGIAEGLNAVIVNPSVVFGAGPWNSGSMTIFNTIQKGLSFYPPGSNAFVDARDVASIMIGLVEKDIRSKRFLCISENLTFYHLFTQIAFALGKKAPRIKVGRFLMGLTWRANAFWAMLTCRNPVVTKHTAHSAFSNSRYSNEKICQELSFSFIPIKESIQNAVEYHQAFD